MNTERTKHYLSEAWSIATRSSDPSTQVGAIVVDVNDHHSFAHNFIPYENSSKLNREEKNRRTIHAEVAAILDAHKWGVDFDGAEMYCTWAVCPHCASVIIDSGIRQVYSLQKTYDATPERWVPLVDEGLKLLESYGVKHSFYCGRLEPLPPIVFNGKLLYPNKDS